MLRLVQLKTFLILISDYDDDVSSFYGKTIRTRINTRPSPGPYRYPRGDTDYSGREEYYDNWYPDQDAYCGVGKL